MKINYNCKNLLFLTNSKNTKKISKYFKIAYQEDPETALKVILYARNIKGGCAYTMPIECFKVLAENTLLTKETLDTIALNGNLGDIAKMYDTANEKNKKLIVKYFLEKLLSNDKLAFKWTPRKGKLFYALANEMKLKIGDFRRFLTSKYISLETLLCNKDYNLINLYTLSQRNKKRYNTILQNIFRKPISHKVKKYHKPKVKDFLKFGEVK